MEKNDKPKTIVLRVAYPSCEEKKKKNMKSRYSDPASNCIRTVCVILSVNNCHATGRPA